MSPRGVIGPGWSEDPAELERQKAEQERLVSEALDAAEWLWQHGFDVEWDL